MPKIHLLHPEVAELIAAGEVIDRPASIVKELVENAIDSGATRIDVELQQGGIVCIRVADDGCGMEQDDLPVAFLRHATSKIFTRDDLEQIATLGFRGEALASIAAVSRVTVTTRTIDSNVGARLVLEGGVATSLEETGCRVGTTIEVRELFYNTPARMKFLRRDVTEANAVALLLGQLAMGNPKIAFTFIRDGKKTLQTQGDGDLPALVRVLRGADVARQMVPLEGNWEGITLHGLISKPMVARQTRSLQSFFINGRYVRSRTCQSALEDAYKNRLMQNRFPACVLFVDLQPGLVDVNVHPAKLEVRFSSERDVYNAVNSACQAALARLESSGSSPPLAMNSFNILQDRIFGQETLSSGVATVRDTSDKMTQLPALDAKDWAQKRAESSEKNMQETQPESPYSQKLASLWHVERANIQNPQEVESGNYQDEGSVDIFDAGKDLPFTVLGEIFKTFIAVQQEDCFCLIDKHAAHERYIYENLRNQINTDTTERQLLLSPAVVELPQEEYFILSENPNAVAAAGLVAEPFGDNVFLIREVAVILNGCDFADLLIQTAAVIRRHNNNMTPLALDELLYSVACRAAVMAGKKSAMPELEKLAKLVLHEGVRYCPHGRPAVMRFTRYEIEKMFGRKD
jgi:DNA mismatch repair protein MutL